MGQPLNIPVTDVCTMLDGISSGIKALVAREYPHIPIDHVATMYLYVMIQNRTASQTEIGNLVWGPTLRVYNSGSLIITRDDTHYCVTMI
jgi:hypothetical protein